MKKFACEIKVGDRVVAGASDTFREVIRVSSRDSSVVMWFINENGEEVYVIASYNTELETMPTYEPRNMMLRCVSGCGVFDESIFHAGSMDKFGNWSIADESGRVYDLDRSMWGRLIHKTPGGSRFIFEPLD